MRLNREMAARARENLFKFIEAHELPKVVTIVNPPIKVVTQDYTEHSIKLINEDTITACIDIHDNDPTAKIGVLNFASFKHPGGGFESNMLAQEEALCYCTNLYPALKRHLKWYEEHSSKLHGGMYANECLYHKDVTIVGYDYDMLMVHKEEFVTVDILTCAAPNKSVAIKSGNTGKYANFDKKMVERCKYVIDVFNLYDCDTLILGAYGCGVFRNDPTVVAKAFKDR